MSRSTRAALALVGVTSLAAMGVGSATAAPSRHTISNAPAWTAHVASSSAVPTSHTVHAKVWLAPRDAAGLASFVAAVSDPRSSSYGQYLSEPQYLARFAPAATQVAAVTSWLKGAGLTVEDTGPDNHYVAVSGTASAINAAFGTDLRQFSVDGRTVLGPATPVTAPDAVAASVVAVTGLDTLAHWVSPHSEADVPGQNKGHRVTLGPPAGFVNAGPCSSYYGEKVYPGPVAVGSQLPYAVCGYVPSQLRDAYGVTASGLTGRGVTVAITDAFQSPTLAKDANTYATRHGDAAFRAGQLTQTHGRGYDPQRVADCGGNGWYGEQTLDVEAAHGIAPDAGVAYYGAASCYDDDLMAALAQTVTDNTASMVSNSWGEPTVIELPDPSGSGTIQVPTIDPSLAKAYEGIFAQGAAQGIGFYFSSGDDGDDVAAWGLKQTDYPASDPYVTAVGGTALAVGKDGQHLWETGWGTDKYSLGSDGTWVSKGYLYGAGGGCALTRSFDESAYQVAVDYGVIFAKPSYQTNTSCPSSRGVPDIAMVGDPTTGMLIGETQAFGGAKTVWGSGVSYGEYRIGGTSLASPLTAGLQAVAQQGGRRIGFANPMIYALRSTLYDAQSKEAIGADQGNIRVDYANGLNGDAGTLISERTFDDDASLDTTAGWDQVTGNGTPTLGYIQAVHNR